MKNLHFLLFLFFTFPLFAQHIAITAEDFNSDGFEDSLKCSYEIGSNFGGGKCELTDGKTKNKFTLSNQGCFCSIKKRIFVDSELQKKENEYFLSRLRKEILPNFRSTPDQSLLWIINSSLNTQKPNEHPYFNLVFNPKMVWRQEAPEPPATYYIEIGVQALSKIIPNQNASSIERKSADKKDYLVYYGDTHFSAENAQKADFTSVVKNETYEILKTAHGIIAKKGKAYKWLFVTDLDINDAPQKMRWASIEEVVLKDNYIILKQALAPDPEYHIYVIDIETGIGGRLKIDFDYFTNLDIELPDLTKEERFSVSENAVFIGRNKEKLKFPLPEIKESLSKMYQSE